MSAGIEGTLDLPADFGDARTLKETVPEMLQKAKLETTLQQEEILTFNNFPTESLFVVRP